MMEVGRYAVSGNVLTQIVGYRQQDAAAAPPTVTMYCTVSTEGGNGWVIAIRNKSNGSRAPYLETGETKLRWYGVWGTVHDATTTWITPNDAGTPANGITGGASIDGLAINTTASTAATNTLGNNTNQIWGFSTEIQHTQNTAGSWCGLMHTISSTDFSGKVFSIHHQQNVGASARFGENGNIIVFKDGSSNWKAFTLARRDGYRVANLDYVTHIAVENATALDSSGSIDWTDITAVAYLQHRQGSSASSNGLGIKNALLMDKSVIVGGGSSYSANFQVLPKGFNQWGQIYLADVQGLSQVLCKSKIQVGDGTQDTYFDMSASSFEYPPDYAASPTDPYAQQIFWNVLDNSSSVGVFVKGGASDTINLTAGVMATATQQSLEFDSASSTSGTYSTSGSSFVGWLPVFKTGITVNGATFKECGEINAKGTTLTNCTISETTSTDAAIAFDTSGGELDTCTIDVTGTSALYHLELGTACDSITLTDVTFTGTPGTDKVHVRKTTGTVTISLSGTTTLAAGDVTTEGATVSIVSDPVYQVVVVSGFTAGSRIQIYDTTNSVELFNGTASAGNTVVSGTTATWTDPTAAAGNRAIRVRVAYVTGATAKGFLELTGLTCGTTSGTASVTYPVTQVNDTVYNNNAITGSGVTGVTFVDSSPDVVNIDVAANTISWKSIYAAWVYYAFTSTGIATDIDYIEGVDEANYILSNMKVKNTSSPSEPLEVTGGYGRDATTGAAIDLVDTTGGTLVFAPDHVVSYAVGSGVTSQDKTDIATAVLSAASSAPIAANIKKVYDLEINGAGTEADPWGPV
jgi:hypothetical protein